MTAVVALPLLYLVGAAFADGELRRRQTPFRVVLGDETYDRLKAGEKTDAHYLGQDRLAPDFVLNDQHGKPWRLREHRGKFIVLNFWTVTCQPCIAEMPSLVQLAEIAARRQDLEVIAVSTDSSWSTVRPLFPQRTPLTVLLDPTGGVGQKLYGTKLYPETWIIDREGIIRLRYDGSRNWADPVVLNLIDAL
ncbi:MAG: TlpA family protein disulfide reductase [Myxococcales bacterium]|nr:TlpA family protein disulfide reductase [Myxococcales bacterium]MCB9707348.1 TlpA family protein disulfide reductase [Myxococcales bacterium]